MLFTPEDIAADVHERELSRAAADGSAADDRWHMRRDGKRFYVSGITTALYRVVQEALTNVFKHASARSVSLIVERRGHELVTIVEDTGRGFDVEAIQATLEAQRRLGLLGMRERVALVDGSLTIDSAPANGATIVVRIPLPNSPEENRNDR